MTWRACKEMVFRLERSLSELALSGRDIGKSCAEISGETGGPRAGSALMWRTRQAGVRCALAAPHSLPPPCSSRGTHPGIPLHTRLDYSLSSEKSHDDASAEIFLPRDCWNLESLLPSFLLSVWPVCITRRHRSINTGRANRRALCCLVIPDLFKLFEAERKPLTMAEPLNRFVEG
jgi:hypothetical protein